MFKIFSNPYIHVIMCLILTVYGQIIIKNRINLYGSLPDGFFEKITKILKFFYDPLIISGFVSAFIASLFWMSAMTSLNITRAYPIMAFAPLLVLFFGIFALNEALTWGKLLGGILVLIGIILSVRF